MEQEFATERIISSELPIKSAYAIDRKRGKATRRATALLAASIAMRLSGNRYLTFKDPINIGEIRKEFVRKGLSRHYAEIITKGAEGNGTDPFWRLFSIDRDNPRRLNLRSTKGPWKQVVFYVSEKKLMDSQVSSRLTKRIAVKVADNAGKLNALFKETMKAINTAQEFLLAYDGTNCGRKDEISQTSVAGENPQDGKNPAAQAEERLLSIAGKQIRTNRALRTIMAYSRASKKKAVEAKREMEKRMNVTFHHNKQYIDKGSIMEARATAEGFLKAGIFATTLRRIPTRVLVQHVDEMAIHTPYRYTYIKYMKKRYAAILRGAERPGREKAKAIREKDLYIPTNLVKDMIFGIRPDTLIYKESKERRDKLAESLSKYSVDTYGMKMAEAALSELAKGKTPATSVKIWEKDGTMSEIWSDPMGAETYKGYEGRPILDYDAKAKSARIGNTVTEFLEKGIRISCGGRSFSYPYGDVKRKKIKPRGEEMPEEFEDRMRFIRFYEGRLRIIGSYAEAIQNRIASMEREARRKLLEGRKEMKPRGSYTGRYDSALYEAARRSGAAPKPYTKEVDKQKTAIKSFQEESSRYADQSTKEEAQKYISDILKEAATREEKPIDPIKAIKRMANAATVKPNDLYDINLAEMLKKIGATLDEKIDKSLQYEIYWRILDAARNKKESQIQFDWWSEEERKKADEKRREERENRKRRKEENLINFITGRSFAVKQFTEENQGRIEGTRKKNKNLRSTKEERLQIFKDFVKYMAEKGYEEEAVRQTLNIHKLTYGDSRLTFLMNLQEAKPKTSFKQTADELGVVYESHPSGGSHKRKAQQGTFKKRPGKKAKKGSGATGAFTNVDVNRIMAPNLKAMEERFMNGHADSGTKPQDIIGAACAGGDSGPRQAETCPKFQSRFTSVSGSEKEEVTLQLGDGEEKTISESEMMEMIRESVRLFEETKSGAEEPVWIETIGEDGKVELELYDYSPITSISNPGFSFN